MKDSESIYDYSGRLSGLATKFAALGSAIDETRLVRKLLTGMPKRFVNIVASIEQMEDLKTLKFEEIVGCLKAFEDRVNSVDDKPESHGKLLSIRQESFTEKERSTIETKKVIRMGDYASACPKRRGKRVEANISEANELTTKKEVLMKISINDQVMLNEENMHPKWYESDPMKDGFWYLDNGASNHMTGMKSYFSELDENVVGKVHFGDSSCVDIKGKGAITIICDDDVERMISNVCFIPNLTSNF
ncbi:uncharacterized protein LOC143607038 [Bidens hawaiensis]|uniref:uncharacterized protein LOC143607038 n=1 Tax=Bidens hawaiensis TaxID=980011 RepID=UPI00404B52D4